MATDIRAIIFDCFGVIITDGLEVITERLEATDKAARAYVAETIRESNMGHIRPSEANRRIAERIGITSEEWVYLVSSGEVRNPDLVNWILSLRKHYKTALLSNVGRGGLTRRFSERELSELFDEIVISAEVGMIKPDPRIYRLAAEKLGVAPEACVFFDDHEVYAQAARDAGMHGLYYRSLPQAQADLEAILRA